MLSEEVEAAGDDSEVDSDARPGATVANATVACTYLT